MYAVVTDTKNKGGYEIAIKTVFVSNTYNDITTNKEFFDN